MASEADEATTGSKDIPKVIWHYTSTATLGKIFDSGKLRLNHADGLNDPLERRLLYDAYDAAVSNYTNGEISRFSGSEYERLRPWLAPFVLSCSKDPDNLLLWLQYADALRGVAMGLRVDKLLAASVIDRPYDRLGPPQLSRVTYGRDQAEALGRSIVERYNAQLQEAYARGSMGSVAGYTNDEALREMACAASQFKDMGWHQESEWRISVNQTLTCHMLRAEEVFDGSPSSRSHGETIHCALRPDSITDSICEVRVGPLADKDEVRSLCHNSGAPAMPITASGIAYKRPSQVSAIVALDQHGGINLPDQARAALGWEEGIQLALEVDSVRKIIQVTRGADN